MHRIAIAIATLAALAACQPSPSSARHEPFTITTDRMTISAEGDPQAFRRHSAQILMRIDSVDPALIRPGIGLWAEAGDGEAHEPGQPGLVLIGRVVAVSPRIGGYWPPHTGEPQ